jgi:hypothetical protein
MAGYSKTPLPQKLGIQEGSRVRVINPPDHFLRDRLGVKYQAQKKADVVMLFVFNATELEKQLRRAKSFMEPHSGLWICWPKLAAGYPTDLVEDLIREIVLPTGLVDNKVCAIDDFWSGLRFVVRLKDR